MATVIQHPTFKIIVETETERAKREFASLSESTQKEAKKISLAMSGDNWGGGGDGLHPFSPSSVYSHVAHSGRYYASHTAWGAALGLDSSRLGRQTFASPWEARKAGIIQAREIRKELEHGAKTIGTSIAYFMMRDVARTFFMSRYVVGGNNLQLEKRQEQYESASATFANAVQMLSMIIMASGMKAPNPWAKTALIVGGSAIAGIGSWLNKGAHKDIENDQQIAREQLSLEDQKIRETRNVRLQAHDYALQRIQDMAGGRTQRIAMAKGELSLSASRFNILRSDYMNRLRGEGGYAKGDAYTKEGERIKEEMELYRSRMYSSAFDLFKLKDMRLQNPMTTNEFADEYARKGLYIGAQVNIQDLNKEILRETKIQTALLREIAKNPAAYDRWVNEEAGTLIR